MILVFDKYNILIHKQHEVRTTLDTRYDHPSKVMFNALNWLPAISITDVSRTALLTFKILHS